MEAEPDHDGAAYRNRCAPARSSFKKSTEGEADKDCLNASIARNPRHRSADNVEVPRLYRNVVEQHRVEDRPADGQQAERSTISKAHRRHLRRHPVDDPGD